MITRQTRLTQLSIWTQSESVCKGLHSSRIWLPRKVDTRYYSSIGISMQDAIAYIQGSPGVGNRDVMVGEYGPPKTLWI